MTNEKRLGEIQDLVDGKEGTWRGLLSMYSDMEWLIQRVRELEKETKIPIVSHACKMTHSACDCVLANMTALEAENRKLKEELKTSMVVKAAMAKVMDDLDKRIKIATEALEKIDEYADEHDLQVIRTWYTEKALKTIRGEP